MDLRRERKRSLKVLEQQEAEFERIEKAKNRYDYAQEINCVFHTNLIL